MSKFEKIINKAIIDPKNTLFIKHKVSPKNVQLIREAGTNSYAKSVQATIKGLKG